MEEKNNRNTVLVIDDEPDIVAALCDKLKKENIRCLAAKNGKEGLDLALEKHPDMIILDIMMPKMDGIAMLRELKKDSWGMRVPVMLLTNVGENEKLAEALELGIVSYLIKSEVRLSEVAMKARVILGLA